jgi:lipoic acid synthetase
LTQLTVIRYSLFLRIFKATFFCAMRLMVIPLAVQSSEIKQKPPWLKRRLPTGPSYESVRQLIKKSRLHTVCQEAKCPNIWECFSQHTATFMIMGSLCTRDCRFCAVEHGPIELPDPTEPSRVADAVQQMELQYVVITSVTRDDLPDGGASIFAETILEIRKRIPDVLVEVLIPDFQGDPQALQKVLAAGPDVLNHNLETVARLYPSVRPGADYHRSLQLLNQSRKVSSIPTKSGLMLGLGENADEIQTTLQDLRDAGCSMLTLGQYLQPTKQHLPVERFVHPEEFEKWQDIALERGFSEVLSGPFVRSSYQAGATYGKLKKQNTEKHEESTF